MFSSRQVVELQVVVGPFPHDLHLMTTLGVETEAPFGLDILKFVRHGARSEDQGASMHRPSSRTQADFQADSQKSTVVDAVIEFQQIICPSCISLAAHFQEWIEL